MKQIIIILALIGLPFSVSSIENDKEFSYQKICKAGIATNVFRKVKNIKTVSAINNEVIISYVKDDGEKYTYTCKILKNEIRWKDKYMKNWNKNLKLFYRITDDGQFLKIKSTASGNTLYEKSYNKADF